MTVAHCCISTDSPVQFLPPSFGAGLLHCLVLICVPPPHVLVHGLNSDQLEKDPSTEAKQIENQWFAFAINAIRIV